MNSERPYSKRGMLYLLNEMPLLLEFATWASWFSRNMFRLEAEDFIFHILQRSFANFGLIILVLCSARSFGVFIFPYFVLSCYILLKVCLKRSTMETYFPFLYSQVAYIVQTNRNKLFFKDKHSYK